MLVVTPIAVYRDAIIHEIARSFPRTRGVASLEELGAHASGRPVLVVMVTQTLDDAARASVAAVHDALDRPRLLLLAAEGNGTVSDFYGLTPLAAMLPPDSSLEALVDALRVIARTGAVVIPQAILERAGTSRIAPPVPADMPLSPREVDVIVRLTHGRSNKEIARDLHMAEPTVRAHIRSILVKLKLHNRTQATVWAMRNGLDHLKDDPAPEGRAEKDDD